MFRFIDLHLSRWAKTKTPHRKPLLLRGARQVGKTFAVRKLGATFKSYIEINFEKQPQFKPIFEKDLDPKRLIRILAAELEQEIVPGKTLLFFDEIQEVPRALLALRYFYEEMPEMHVLAAGSLLSLAIEEVGVPVGRVSFFYIYPMSFIEFLKALKREKIIEEIFRCHLKAPMDNLLHEKTLELLSEYFVIGGMPAVIQAWIDQKDSNECLNIHQSIIDTYRSDFPKYAKRIQVKYVETIFSNVPLQLGQRFKFSQIPGEYRKRELVPALELLNNAHIVHSIYHSDGQGLPLRAQINLDKFKTILLDVGLAQAMLGGKVSDWLIEPKQTMVNKGAIVEAFIGQELLAYADPFRDTNLYYWHRESKNSMAEVDYLFQVNDKVVPIEVKSNKGNTLKSINLFLDSHPKSNYGVRFSTHNFSQHEKILSYPLYAIANFLKLAEIYPELILSNVQT